MVCKELSLSEMIQEFREFDRDNFSVTAYEYLYEMFDEHNVKLDVIATCCQYSEYDTIKDYMDYYLSDDEVQKVLKENNITSENDITLGDLDNQNYTNYHNIVVELENGHLLVSE